MMMPVRPRLTLTGSASATDWDRHHRDGHADASDRAPKKIEPEFQRTSS